jgi:AcrR family transcriptional regulator
MPRSYDMKTRGQQTAATRQRLLDAAVEGLAEVGVEALTMQSVAERADVALRTVYNHFASKEELIVEAYDRLAGATKERYALLPADGAPRARVGWMVDAMYDVLDEQSPGTHAIMRVSGVPQFDHRLHEVRGWRREAIAAVLRPADDAGELLVPLEQAVALVFVATSYATWNALVHESGLSQSAAKDLSRRAVDTVLFGA